MIQLRTLGAVDLRSAGGSELRAALAQPKRVALLVYVALATPRGPQRRDTLLALFWPEQDEDRARNALNQAVHFLRRTMGPETLVARDGDALSLEWGQFWCDAVAFEEALDAGRLADALELYRGDLLEGFHVTDVAPELERWVEAERDRLARRYAAALEQAANEREAAGDFAGAASWWRRLAARDPYGSRIALRLMRALAQAGEAAAAVQHARVHAALVQGDLGVPPDPEVEALVRQLQTSPPRAVVREPVAEAKPLAGPGPPAGGAASPRLGRRRLAIAAGAVVALVLATAAIVSSELGRRPASRIRSVAVLPLVTLSSDSMHQLFAEGMHDALITELARYPGLSVISRASVLRYREDGKQSLPQIARELGVDGIVEGTVLWEGGTVRMNAQLVHGPSDRHLWAESYRRDLRDMLALQADLAAAIAREVRVRAAPASRPRPQVAGPRDSVPEELYLMELYRRGRQAELSRSLAGLQTAKAAYQRAVARDSTFALGYAGLAGVYGFMASYSYAPLQASLDSARMLAQRAVALDSSLADARIALGVTLGDAHQFADAEREFRRAIDLEPSNARAHYWYSILLVVLGRGEEALRAAQRAQELDAFPSRGLIAMQRYATWLVTGVRPELQLPVRERRQAIFAVEPAEPWARAREAIELAQVGECAAARTELERARMGVPPDNIQMLQFIGQVDWRCGQPGRARAILERMKRHPEARDHTFSVAWLYTVMGDKDSALVWLQRHRWLLADLSMLSAGRPLDPLRSDPRYSALLQRLGLRPQN